MILHNGNRLGKNHFHGGKQTLFHSPIEIGNRCTL